MKNNHLIFVVSLLAIIVSGCGEPQSKIVSEARTYKITPYQDYKGNDFLICQKGNKVKMLYWDRNEKAYAEPPKSLPESPFGNTEYLTYRDYGGNSFIVYFNPGNGKSELRYWDRNQENYIKAPTQLPQSPFGEAATSLTIFQDRKGNDMMVFIAQESGKTKQFYWDRGAKSWEETPTQLPEDLF